MVNNELGCHVAVISYKRPQNVKNIQQVMQSGCTFYVNIGEAQAYLDAGATYVVECGTNICQARNVAITAARQHNLPSIQVSDDARGFKYVQLVNGKQVVIPVTFAQIVNILVNELRVKNYNYGGVAVSSNRLNYTGEDFSYNKLVVCDLICMMPSKYLFDEDLALKEDYDMTIQQLIDVGGLVRCNQFLCDFPHRENKGGANTYRNSDTEDAATQKLLKKWAGLIKKHATRPGQISLDYRAIQQFKNGQKSLF